MMPLSVAMAMSGLEADEFTDFKEIYNHGVALIDNKSKLLINNNDRRSSSSASNGSSTSTTTTAESGIDLNMCLMERPICINKNIAHRCPSFDVNMNEYKKYCDNNSSATNFNQIIIKEVIDHLIYFSLYFNYFYWFLFFFCLTCKIDKFAIDLLILID